MFGVGFPVVDRGGVLRVCHVQSFGPGRGCSRLVSPIIHGDMSMSTACPQLGWYGCLVDKPDIDIYTLLGVTSRLQVCFCGPQGAALPAEPLGEHSLGCLWWDWALANDKITPLQRLEQVEAYDRGLGNPQGD